MPHSGTDADFGKLIPELQFWNNGRGVSVEAWVGAKGNFELAVGYSTLFWPKFIEFDGCIFFSDFSEESYRSFMDQCNGDRQSVEMVVNHRHVFDYFSHTGGLATLDQILYLGRVMKDILQAKLARDFPGRTFVVTFSEETAESLDDYEVTFHQARLDDQPTG